MMPTRSCFRFAVATSLSLALAACGGGGNAPKSASSVAVNAGPVERATDLLNAGKDKDARKLLEKTLKKDASNADARLLLDSIEQDPMAQLGSASYPYVVRPGETLMSLAERFLGSRLKFYALARYNGIAVPASVSLGQLIRIPGQAPKTKPEVAPEPEKPAVRPEPTAKPKPKKEAPVAAAPAAPVAPKPAGPNPAMAGKLRGAGLAALAQGNVVRAVALLRRAAALDPANPLIQRDLARAQRIAGTVQTKR